MSKNVLITTVLTLLLAPLALHAETEIPNVLNPDFRINSTPHFELIPYGGSYLGSSVGQTFITGAKAYYHLDSTWAFGTNFGYAYLMTDGRNNFGGILQDDNLYLGDIEATISNDVAMRVGRSLVEIDFYLTLGAGMMRINNYNEPMGVIGGGAKLYTGLDWLAFTVDVMNYAHYTDQPGKDTFDFDVTFTGGLCFMFNNSKKNK